MTAGLNFNLLSLKTGLAGALTTGFETVTDSIGAAANTISQTMVDLSGSTDVNINIHDLVTCAGGNISEQMAKLSLTLKSMQVRMEYPNQNNGFKKIHGEETDENGITYPTVHFEMNKTVNFEEVNTGINVNVGGNVNVSGGVDAGGNIDASGYIITSDEIRLR